MSALDAVRALARGRVHGGYRWALVLSDGETLCETCTRSEYRQVFRSTRDGERDGWAAIGLTHSGEHDDGDAPVTCAHCNAVLWGAL